MPFPNLDNFNDAPIFTAAESLRHRGIDVNRSRFPSLESVIFCYQSALPKYAAARYGTKKVDGFYGNLHLLKKTDGRVALASGFGIGAPVVAVLMEELAAFGVRRFLSIGVAGGLKPSLHTGDVLVCDRAIRDEGTSHHYVPSSKFAIANEQLVAALCAGLDEHGLHYAIGSSWTTDAPYRETRAEIEQYQKEGVLSVEMEAAALFAVGQRLQIPAGAAFVIGDTFDGARWQLDFDTRVAERGLQKLLDVAIAAMLEPV
jgi:uridine phosphorylase